MNVRRLRNLLLVSGKESHFDPLYHLELKKFLHEEKPSMVLLESCVERAPFIRKGNDLFVGKEYAAGAKCPLHFIDRPISVTANSVVSRRQWRFLSVYVLEKLCNVFPRILVQTSDYYYDEGGMSRARLRLLWGSLFEYWTIRSRDSYMAANIDRLLADNAQSAKVVAIVGDLHVRGLYLRLLKGNFSRYYDFKRIPPLKQRLKALPFFLYFQ